MFLNRNTFVAHITFKKITNAKCYRCLERKPVFAIKTVLGDDVLKKAWIELKNQVVFSLDGIKKRKLIDVPKLYMVDTVVFSYSCFGCENGCLGQRDHMEEGGCLYADDLMYIS